MRTISEFSDDPDNECFVVYMYPPGHENGNQTFHRVVVGTVDGTMDFFPAKDTTLDELGRRISRCLSHLLPKPIEGGA